MCCESGPASGKHHLWCAEAVAWLLGHVKHSKCAELARHEEKTRQAKDGQAADRDPHIDALVLRELCSSIFFQG